ncbi:MAG: hypothetical protein JWO59_2156 [Chloroflexi bacterium]|nr:hypothetical protein [Chloroflexota bacterium]
MGKVWLMGMAVVKREEIERTLDLLEASGTSDAHVRAAAETLKRALRDAEARHLLTTAEAAEALGIRSINTVKRWVKTGYIQGVQRNERIMIPVTEIERIHDDDRVRALRASSQLHEEVAEFSGHEGLSDEELAGMAATRPGRPPWSPKP